MGVLPGGARATVRYAPQDGGKNLRAGESFRGSRVSYDDVRVFTKAE